MILKDWRAVEAIVHRADIGLGESYMANLWETPDLQSLLTFCQRNRDEFDRLKAILYNCIRHGPASQNREGRAEFRSHLLGRVSHASLLNPERGRRLREMFDRIVWNDADPPAIVPASDSS